jgi:hypothetical protein
VLPWVISTISLASADDRKNGAYGLRLTGIEGVDQLLLKAPGWPTLEVVRRFGESRAREDAIGPDRALIRLLGGGEVALDRAPARATYTMPRELSAEELIHPYLAPAAAVVGRWLGRESFHAGAFATGGGAWVIVGDKGAGKSSTLAGLWQRGVPILTDDVVVMDDERVFAGPRMIDLREESARALGIRERVGAAGERERWRVPLGRVEPELPLRGWIMPAWTSEAPELVKIPAAERLARLARSRVIGVETERPELLLKLAALPAWEFRRPSGWDGFTDGLERLLETVAV